MEPIDDPQLKKLLHEWKVEDAPCSLNERVLGAKQSWWKLLIGGSVRVPVPIVLGFAVLLVVMGAALVRLRPSPARQSPPFRQPSIWRSSSRYATSRFES